MESSPPPTTTTTHEPHIVCCLDGSDAALHAAQLGLALVPSDNRRVTLVTAIPLLDPAYISGADPTVPVALGVDFAEITEEHRRTASAMLNKAAPALGLTDAAHMIVEGTPDTALRDYAEDGHADLLIVGAVGRGKAAHATLGSVADYLVRKAHCPVLVVGQSASSGDGPVVVGTDGSRNAEHAAARSLALLAGDVPLTLLTVAAHAPRETSDDGLAQMDERRWSGEEDAVLARLATSLQRDDATHVVRAGDPGPTLAAYATEVHARALVIGAKGHGSLLRAVLGSIAHDTVRRADCPVFIAGPHN
jgi:nucleotide-binding universal stress UspA family protein